MKKHFFPIALGASMLLLAACEDPGPTDTCCAAFSNTQEAFEQGFHLQLTSVSPGARGEVFNKEATFAPSINEYLCSVHSSMKDLNNEYIRDDGKDYNKTCSDAQSKYATILSDIKKAYTDCCAKLGPEPNDNNAHDFDQVYQCSKLQTEEQKVECNNRQRMHEIQYTKCFVTYIKNGTCEAQ